MRIAEKILRTLVRNQLLQEAFIDRLIQKYPDDARVLMRVSNSGVSNAGLDWYARLLQTNWGDYEDVEDVIPTLLAFDKNKNSIAARARAGDLYVPGYSYAKYSADINEYENVADLRLMINHLESKQRSKKEKEGIKRDQTTYVYKSPRFNVVMPHTVESSCFWGLDTQWCTAATKSQNLFLSYVARNRSNIVLYYIIKKGANPRQDPYAKMSVGYVNGVPQLRAENGGVSVNVKNVGLGVEDLEEELGAEYEPIMAAMNKHAGAIEGKHPAKRQMEDAAKSLDLFKKYTRGMERETLNDFINEILKGYKLSREVGMYLATDKDSRIREMVAENAGPEVATWILRNDKTIWVAHEALHYAGDQELLDMYAREPEEFFKRFPAGTHRYGKSDIYLAISNNGNSSDRTLLYLMNIWPDAQEHIAQNERSSPEILMSIYRKNPYSGVQEGYADIAPIYRRLAENPQTPSEILSHMLNFLLKEPRSPDDGTKQLFRKILRNPMLRPDELRKASLKIDDGNMFVDVLANPSITPEFIQEIWDKRYHLIIPRGWTLLRLASMKKTPTKILLYLSQHPRIEEAVKKQALQTLKNKGER